MTNSTARHFVRFALTACAVLLGFHGAVCRAAEPAAAPATPAISAPPAGQYRIDKAHASLLVRASHMGFSTYTTRFGSVDASLSFDPANIAASKVVATIDADSFQTDAWPQKCIDIMKGAQMLDVAKHPQIVFRSDRVRMTGAKSFEIDGTLDLLGVKRPVVLAGTYNGGYAGMAQMDPQARIGFSAHAAFKRSDFGMSFGIPAPGTTIGVGDLVDVSIEAEFTGPPLVQAGGGKK
jgi:polyisoprenoid-binding protein YceI